MESKQDWYYWENQIGQVLRSPRTEHDDLIRGECSGIPPCCIEFFIEKWGLDVDSVANAEHEKRMDALRERFYFQYVPCPDCITAERFVEIRSCDGPHCFCGQWESRQLISQKLDDMEPHVRKAYRKWRRKIRANRKRRRGYA